MMRALFVVMRSDLEAIVRIKDVIADIRTGDCKNKGCDSTDINGTNRTCNAMFMRSTCNLR